MTEEEKKLKEQQEAANNIQTEGSEIATTNSEQAVAAAPVAQEKAQPQLRNWYEQLFRQDNAGEAEQISEEQRRKMARRERAERVIAGLGDIGTHIANIAFAGKGATPAKPTTTMSANIDNAWQRYNQDIEQRRKAYRQGVNAARQMDYRQYLEDRKYNLSLDREERLRWQQEHKYDLDKLREAKTKAEIARIEKRTPAEIAVLEQQAAYWEARANESQARADGRIPTRGYSGGGNKGGSGGGAGRYSTPDGASYKSADLFHAALIRLAREYGVEITTKKGKPHVTDWGILYDEIERKMDEKGLPRQATQSLDTSKPTANKSQEKMDISQFQVKKN